MLASPPPPPVDAENVIVPAVFVMISILTPLREYQILLICSPCPAPSDVVIPNKEPDVPPV